MTPPTTETLSPVAATMDALVLRGPRDLRVEEVATPDLKAGHCLVQVAYVGLCGTDGSFYDGSSSYLATGLKSYPFVLGHEWSGTVAAVAPDVAHIQVGDRVAGHNFITCDTCSACRSGHRLLCPNRSEMGVLGDYPGAGSQYALVPAKVLAPIPDSLTDVEAALLEPGSTAMHAINRVDVHADDTVAVLGTGTLGLIAIQLAAARGATVHAFGVEEAGLALAHELGAERAMHPSEAESNAYSVVIEASGSSHAGAQIPDLVAFGGRVALVGVAHHPVPEFATNTLVIKNVTIHAVLSGIEQWDRLIEATVRGTVKLDTLVEEIVPYSNATQAFDALSRPGKKRPKVLLEFTPTRTRA